jgi:hypothetical protein
MRQESFERVACVPEQREQFDDAGAGLGHIARRSVGGASAVAGHGEVDRVWTLPEIAEAARISLRTLFSIRRAGQGPWPPVRGTRTRFHDSVVQCWLRGELSASGRHSSKSRASAA